MKRSNLFFMTCVLGMVGGSAVCLADEAGKGAKKILFYSESCEFRHGVVTRELNGDLSIAEKVLKAIGEKAGYKMSFSQDRHDLKSKKCFDEYDAIVLYTSGNPRINREAMLKWLRAGGALIGTHAATDSFRRDADYAKGWPDYVRIMGGAFNGHGSQQPATMKIEDPDHPATRVLNGEWVITDEMYQFHADSFSRDNVHVLLSIDTDKTPPEALKGLKMEKGKDYPVAWTNTEGKGRVFYTSLGHRPDVWTNPTYQKHLLGGIAWALGQSGDKKTAKPKSEGS